MDGEYVKRVKKKRIALGLSHASLGRLLGVHWSSCCRWENDGKVSPPDYIKRRLDLFLSGKYDPYIRALLAVFPNCSGILGLPLELCEALKVLWLKMKRVKSFDSEIVKISLDDLCKESLELYIADVFKARLKRKTRKKNDFY